MPDPDRPDLDKFGEPTEEIDEGSLLFDPSGPYDPEDDDYFGDEPEEERSRAPILWGAGALVALGVVVGLQLLGERDPTDGVVVDTTAVVPMLPVDTVSRAALSPVPTDTVEGPIGSSVRVAVRATGHTGAPMRDSVLRFSVVSGAGTLREDEVSTTAEGIAVNFVELPSEPGATRLSVALPASGLEPATIVAIARPGPPDRLLITGGNGQEAEVGRLLPERAAVRVVDSLGNPVPGAIVRFRIASGDGLMAARSRTDSLGQASALWRLGPLEGEQTLIASVSSLPQEITFTATATPQATLEVGRNRPGATSVTVVRNSLAVGGSHACSLAGGNLSCRGTNERGQATPSGDHGFVAVAAGASHTCGLSTTGVASCWGANDEGQLGDGSRDDRSTPSRVRTELRFSMLAAGEAHTCGLAGGGTPLCWGENLSGQIGDGTRNNQTVPRVVGGGVGFREIAAGWSHTCGRGASGNTFCWGQNNHGQLGDGSTLDRLQPSLVLEAAGGLVAGSAHTCGIGDGGALCWGANEFGQLGDGTTDDRTEPVAVTGLPGRPIQLAAGAVHSCALLADGRAFCWGQNRQGQLGDGTTQNRSEPVPVAGELRFAEIHAGGAQTCGITGDGVQYCWGLNLNGQLGDGTRMNRAVPTRVVQ